MSAQDVLHLQRMAVQEKKEKGKEKNKQEACMGPNSYIELKNSFALQWIPTRIQYTHRL